MKKFLLVFAIIFVVNLSCKREQIICGCSPIPSAALQLVVKNANGEDLLNPATNGVIAQNSILLIQKDANGIEKNIDFFVRPPFSYGNDKFLFYQIYSSAIVTLSQDAKNSFYLKFGNKAPLELKVQFNKTTNTVEKLLVDQKEVPKETAVNTYNLSIFYINL